MSRCLPTLRTLRILTVCAAGLLGCRRHDVTPAPAGPGAQTTERAPSAPAPSASPGANETPRSAMRQQEGPRPALPEPRPLRRCFPTDIGGSPPRVLDVLLDRAADLFDGGDFEGSLACAEEAARTDPGSVEAHHERADALRELKRLPEAQDAFARALALDPDDPKTLDGIADFYINRLPASNDHLETGLAYARHGSLKLKRSKDKNLIAHLALLEGEALSDLGRSREALARLDAALAILPGDPHVLYERAVAEFELCRFDDAKADLVEVLRTDPKDAAAHHQLGLVLERTGDVPGAERELSRARALSPRDFHEPVLPTPEEFRTLVEHEASRLPDAVRADLSAVSLEVADLPAISDLVAEEPPLSPTILGLFRGIPMAPASPPATEPGGPKVTPSGPASREDRRTIVLYRRNLGRAVLTRDDLVAQIRTTLLHELGHLRGEDDEDLRARGLE